MQQHPQYTRLRIAQLVERVRRRIYADTVPVEDLVASQAVDRISFEEAQRLAYAPARPGLQLGPAWATFWFKGRAPVPSAWAGSRVDLIWQSGSEATLWLDGRSVGGINPGRDEVPLVARSAGGETVEFQVEAACNGLFGQQGRPYRSVEPYLLDRCDLGRFDPEAWELYYDLAVLSELEREEDLDRDWRGRLLSELNRVANLYREEDRATWAEARRIAAGLYGQRNASYRHQVNAVGHAHIDTAWLWPIAETWRKCVRTFSTAVLYMDEYPEYRFACSQAVQYAEMKARFPDLYRRMQEKHRTGQWVPVGGTWVEPDCNIPSGEALCRQFLFGQRLFESEFGQRCREFWNPDVFGYNGQLPQIMRQAGIRYFLTQKLSWNHFNKPQHQTFLWQGLDGSEVLTHFPPANTYNAVATVEELRRSVREYRDHDRSGHSLLLFGIGDGGGGPTRDMLERLRRAQDLQGLPRTAIRAPADFFAQLEENCRDLPVRVGELYFELHRGTYTTQAAAKRGNRKAELLLHDVEFVAALGSRLGQAPYPKEALDQLWRLLLVNQFHDILPGSSIRPVYVDAGADHARIQQEGERLRDAALRALAGGKSERPLNTTAFARQEVAEKPGGGLVFAEAPPYGFGQVRPPHDQVVCCEEGERVLLENGQVKAVLGRDGTLLGLVEKASGREALDGPANRLVLYEDRPTNWDAWDIDPFALETARDGPPAASCAVQSSGPLRAEVRFTRNLGQASTVEQIVRLDAGARRLEFHTEVEWRENETMLKVAFPVAVRALEATYEMQFGHARRPTHYNTPYDLARFEVPGHKWVDLSEHGFGVALLTDCKYGYHTFGNTMHITLLRAPSVPDPAADRGHHAFAYAVLPHTGGWQEAGVVGQAACFNAPLLWAKGDGEPSSYFAVDDPNLVLDTVKRAEDREALLLRLYEAHGGRGCARLLVGLPFRRAVRCNILEDEEGPLTVTDGAVEIPYRPHQIISLLLE